jgi:four helix bundle protein
VVSRFEELVAWQEARKLTKMIYQITNEGRFTKDYGLSGQIQRASVSVMSNIAEGFGRNNPGEFHQFLVIALGSCHELRSQLYVAYDVDYITEDAFNNLSAQSEKVAKIVGALRASVERNKRSKPST